MNIVIVIWSIQVGGAETFAVNLCEYLIAKGRRPCLFPVLGNWNESYYQSIREKGIFVLSPFKNKFLNWCFWKLNAFFNRLGKSGLRQWINMLFLNHSLKKRSINVILSNSYISDLFVSKCSLNNIPHIIIEHGEYSYAAMDNTEIDIQPLLKATTIVSVSKWCQAMLKDRFDIQSTVVYNGFYKKKSEPFRLKNDAFVFCMMGRGIAYKGWEDAILSFIIVRSLFPDIKLILIGSGVHLNQLKDDYGNETGISFVESVNDPTPLIANCDAGLVLSRRYEAFGIVLLEFFALGIPVIATSVGAIPEVINLHGKPGGIMVNVSTDGKAITSELVNAMTMLIQNEDIRNSLGGRAKEIADYYSFEKTGNEYLALIDQVCNNA